MEKSEEQLSEEKFISALYDQPLSKETSRLGIAIVVLGFVDIAIAQYGATLEPTSAWPIRFPEGADVLPTLLGWALVLLMLSFGMRGMTEYLKSRELNVLITKYIQGEKTRAAFAEAKAADDMVYGGENARDDDDPDAWWEQASKVQAASEAAVKSAEGALGLRRAPRVLRFIRITAELVVPFGIGVFAIAEGWHLDRLVSSLFEK